MDHFKRWWNSQRHFAARALAYCELRNIDDVVRAVYRLFSILLWACGPHSWFFAHHSRFNVDVPITVDSTRPPEFSDLPHAPALEANLQQGASVFAYTQALTYGAEQILSEM